MIMYSVVADEVIYAGIEDIQMPVEMRVDGILMQVEVMSYHEVKVIRILSSELAPYLNSNFLPGQIIKV